jgi:hypothetical protein
MAEKRDVEGETKNGNLPMSKKLATEVRVPNNMSHLPRPHTIALAALRPRVTAFACAPLWQWP